jgi:hypothetical protein
MDTQREPRVAEETPTGGQADESQAPQAAAVTSSPMLANPRRVRRA